MYMNENVFRWGRYRHLAVKGGTEYRPVPTLEPELLTGVVVVGRCES